jgi:phage gp29-like protein
MVLSGALPPIHHPSMITLYDFHGMNTQEKADAIWQGQYISSRIDGESTVQLYNLGSFYAEVFYDAKSNEIKKIRAFKTTQLIEPYLSNIKLSL